MGATITDFLLAPPPTPPEPPSSPWEGVGMTWTGCDGSVWDLLDSESPVILKTVRGLHMPTWDRYSQSSLSVPGPRHRGSRASGREVVWTVELDTRESSAAFVALDDAWWRSLDPDLPGTWAVRSGDVVRTLDLRLVEATDDMDTDPTLYGTALYQLSLEPDIPFWRGQDISAAFGAGVDVGFFAPSGGVLRISPGNTLARAAITNPGDEPTWPIWTITGPCSSVAVGVAGRLVTLGAIPSGQVRIVDTTASRRTVTDPAGVDHSTDVDSADWAPIPKGTVALDITAGGTGAGFGVAVTAPTWYRRAW